MEKAKEERFIFEKNMLLGVCTLALCRSLFSFYQFIAGEADMINTIGQLILFIVYAGSFTYLLIKGYSQVLAILFAFFFLVLTSMLWIHNGGLTGVVEDGLITALLLAAIINKRLVAIYMVGLVFVVEIALILIWNFQYDSIAQWVGTDGNQVSKYQVLLLIVTAGIMYFTYLYNSERRKQWALKDELHRTIAEIRKENQKLEDQELEIKELNEMLARMVKDRKSELRRQTESIQRYIDLSSSQISPNLEQMTEFIDKSGFEGDYGKLLKKSSTNLIKSFMKIHKQKKD